MHQIEALQKFLASLRDKMIKIKMKNKKRGVTLVELMVVVALMAIIFIPLVQIFKSFTNAWWAGKARMTVQAEARDAMYWFTKDMKGAYRHTIGNLVRNGGFDSGGNTISSSIIGWQEATAGVLPAGVVKISSPSTRGFCVGVNAGVGIVYTST
ncbi:MAG: prepilin-type N-terminal cleavage/methylation domain-containing protein, partial [Elusimicrobiota bacterium]|nr:prepilin-type N-terminal cleavage/methylation domain-containing protein [Elusimicrobiota bacterium]